MSISISKYWRHVLDNVHIKDINGDEIEGCVQFGYRGYMISISTILKESGDIKVFLHEEDNEGIGCKNIQEAFEEINSLAGDDSRDE